MEQWSKKIHTSSKVQRSKVKVARPLWVGVQVNTCRGGVILWRPHSALQAAQLV